jgi:hypothetical protein
LSKKRCVIRTYFSTIETFVSTKETFVSTTSYAAIPYCGTLLWKAVQNQQVKDYGPDVKLYLC